MSSSNQGGESDGRHSRSWIPNLQALPQFVFVALASYTVVGLFAAAYGVVVLVWPSLSTAGTVTIATLVAGPLALALLWPHLTGLKAFGIEVTLARFEVGVSGELVAGSPPRSWARRPLRSLSR